MHPAFLFIGLSVSLDRPAAIHCQDGVFFTTSLSFLASASEGLWTPWQ